MLSELDFDKVVVTLLGSDEFKALSSVLRKERSRIRIFSETNPTELTVCVNSWLTDFWEEHPNGTVYDIKVVLGPHDSICTVLYRND